MITAAIICHQSSNIDSHAINMKRDVKLRHPPTSDTTVAGCTLYQLHLEGVTHEGEDMNYYNVIYKIIVVCV